MKQILLDVPIWRYNFTEEQLQFLKDKADAHLDPPTTCARARALQKDDPESFKRLALNIAQATAHLVDEGYIGEDLDPLEALSDLYLMLLYEWDHNRVKFMQTFGAPGNINTNLSLMIREDDDPEDMWGILVTASDTYRVPPTRH